MLIKIGKRFELDIAQMGRGYVFVRIGGREWYWDREQGFVS